MDRAHTHEAVIQLNNLHDEIEHVYVFGIIGVVARESGVGLGDASKQPAYLLRTKIGRRGPSN